VKFQAIAADVRLGKDVTIFEFVNLYGCEIGDETRIGTFVEIQRGAKVGRRVKISSHTFICEGVEIADDVFVGHGVTFINDKYPRAVTASGALQTSEDWKVVPTIVRRGASIGSSSAPAAWSRATFQRAPSWRGIPRARFARLRGTSDWGAGADYRRRRPDRIAYC
jgi:UDP-2-acetamido-3-amino-2,3-dideoxy-glucuronate N-acetyltransferase